MKCIVKMNRRREQQQEKKTWTVVFELNKNYVKNKPIKKHSRFTDLRDPGPAAGLRVSPTFDSRSRSPFWWIDPIWKEKSNKDSRKGRTWTEDHSLKNLQSIHLGYLRADDCRLKKVDQTISNRTATDNLY